MKTFSNYFLCCDLTKPKKIMDILMRDVISVLWLALNFVIVSAVNGHEGQIARIHNESFRKCERYNKESSVPSLF
jgi:hypothetical protein